MNKALKIIAIILGFLLVVVVIVYLISWLRAKPVDQAAFFDARPGEHSPLVFSHQGGEAIRPTNTMIAFRDSVAIGADVLDADMHMTSDGVLVLAHDETVDRTSNGTGAIRDMTLAELRALDFGHNFTIDDGATYPYRGQGHGIVTVEELFTAFPDARFGIEIKQTTTEAATKFCDMIKLFNYTNTVLVSSFAQENMDVFREACPSVATSATEDEARQFFIYQMLGLVGLYSPPFVALQVPEFSGDTHVLNPNFISNAKKRGLKIIPWTINETDDFRRMIELGADGINTNYPDRLVDYLNQ